MIRYTIGIREVHIRYVEVMANSPDEAKAKVYDTVMSDEINIEYSHDLDKELWTVEKQ